jgi:uncharacterized repeat protein (TIGR03806 family)
VDANDELYILTMGEASKLQKLTRGTSTANVPLHLSETGAFKDLGQLEPDEALLSYDVQTPLWSDGTEKKRWIALPAEAPPIAFSPDGPWSFPSGTVLIKHFEMPIDDRQPWITKRLETRFLIAAADGTYFGLTYKWNSAGTDADLVFSSELEDVPIISQDGSVSAQRYLYPGPGDCLVCHNAGAGYVLGVRTGQINRAHEYAATDRVANQLSTWSAIGWLDTPIDSDQAAQYIRYSGLADETRPLEDRLKSYWATNCGMCHGVSSGIKADWDARYSTPLAEQGIVYGLPSSGTAIGGPYIVTPGDLGNSILYQRSLTADPNTRMPPLGRGVTDTAYVEVLHRWIMSLPPDQGASPSQ